jgi:hypothetical protein
MFQLKPISKEGIPEALEKAERYRLLNEPRLAESICLDILEIDPENKQAIVIMILAITDQFGTSALVDLHEVRQFLLRLPEGYDRHYYSGIVCERRGKAVLDRAVTGSESTAYEWLIEAMSHYEKAEAIRPAGNDDAILRWNTCARMIMRNHLKPHHEERMEHPLDY